MRCAEARARLQALHDAGQAPDAGLGRHLAGCAGCSGFAAFLSGFGTAAREALDAASAGLPRPDYPGIVARAAEAGQRAVFTARRSRLAFAAAAAVLAAGVGFAVGARAWVGHGDRAMVATGVRGFVDELFAEPLLAHAGFPVEERGTGFREWLEEPGSPYLP